MKVSTVKDESSGSKSSSNLRGRKEMREYSWGEATKSSSLNNHHESSNSNKQRQRPTSGHPSRRPHTSNSQTVRGDSSGGSSRPLTADHDGNGGKATLHINNGLQPFPEFEKLDKEGVRALVEVQVLPIVRQQRLVQIQEDKETAVVVSFLEMYCDQIRDLGKAYLDKDSGSGDSGSRQTTTDWYEENKRRQAGKYRPGSRGNSGSRNGARSKTPNKKSVGISGTRFARRGVGLATASEYVSQDLTIHEDSMGNVFVKDLSVIPVSTPEECLTVVQMGFKLRATHETKMNSKVYWSN